MSTQSAPMNPFTKLAQTIVNMLTAVDTTINMANRLVNTADSYTQVVERHADDYNHSSKIISAKRREQLEEQYRLLSDNEKQILAGANIFDHVEETPKATTKRKTA